MSDNRTPKKVMISSTARDLPEHRKQVMDACLRQTMFPVMMEHLPANDLEAIAASLKMVDEAAIYLGIYAYRYGYVPKEGNPDQISVTEMEYRRAKERGIPRLIFMMHDDHPVKRTDVETGEGEAKLKAFKEAVGLENILNFFASPEELRSLVINSLSQLPKDNAPPQYHYVHPLTTPPEPYIAHPYTLSQATGLIGRKPELNVLTDWITGKRGLDSVRIFNVVAIGGMGKSALTWEWFSNIAPLESPHLAGRFWWSFYESDAYFENFVIRALAYVSRRGTDEVQKMSAPEREAALLHILDREPHLLVLDGLERILIAYAHADAARMLDDDQYDRRTANFMAQDKGLSKAEQETFLDGHRLRKTADPRAGQFLRKLAQVRASRILISTRLYPFDLQVLTGNPWPGCFALFLYGLSDDDALALWRHFGCTGGRDQLLRLFGSFQSHPLLLQILAGEIARFRPAPGDFDRWHEQNPEFNPFEMKLIQAKTHILRFAFQGLSEAEMRVLQTISAFRMPTQYDTLLAVCTGDAGKPCADSTALDKVLGELEDRGILSWERKSNRYDLHPVVRGVAWTLAGSEVQQVAYLALQGYFEAAPKIDYDDINSIEDLTPAIELYHALIGLGRFEEACDLFYERIQNATLYRLGTSRQQLELLEKLFPDGLDELPRLSKQGDLSYTYTVIALAYQFSGEPGKSSFFLERAVELDEAESSNLAVDLCNLSDSLRKSGRLREGGKAAQRALEICRKEKERSKEAVSLYWLGLATAAAGQFEESRAFLEQSKQIFIEKQRQDGEGLTEAHLAQHALWFSTHAEAKTHADRAWELAHVSRNERDFIRSACRQGQAALALGNHTTAYERLHHALTRARAIHFVEEELPALTALAELARQQGDPKLARELLADVWEAAERGPFPLLHADACNVLCQIERDAGNQAAAIAAAEDAFRLAWCGEGPPWAYHFGLENARLHLRELGWSARDFAGLEARANASK
ncbi:MAG: DUF4062 domain-containing protein [Saprospiraceae bacterium]|nr:DUF4062 domain-containing protein [Saprospiraceae bacterium]